MREIHFYRKKSGKCPVEEFFDTLSDKQVEKILWVLRIIRDTDFIPREYFKKLINADDIWEIRIKSGGNTFRILGFFHKNKIIILTNGFMKKTQKTPSTEIKIAQDRKLDYLERNK
jgi:phage-related protein